MAIDAAEMLRRLASLVTGGWFGSLAPIRDIVFGGVADALVWIHSQSQVVRAGTRRFGTTGWLLDIDAFGFFGSSFLRRLDEGDDAWRKRYTDEIFRPRVTRQAIDKALYDLTGRHPQIMEPWNTADCGGYGAGRLAYAGGVAVAPRVAGYGASIGGYGAGRIGYGVRSQPAGTSPGAGRYGSLSYPYQVFIIAYRPARPSIGTRAGYGSSRGGYGIGNIGYADLSEIESVVSDTEILATVARTVAAGITAWVAVLN